MLLRDYCRNVQPRRLSVTIAVVVRCVQSNSGIVMNDAMERSNSAEVHGSGVVTMCLSHEHCQRTDSVLVVPEQLVSDCCISIQGEGTSVAPGSEVGAAHCTGSRGVNRDNGQKRTMRRARIVIHHRRNDGMVDFLLGNETPAFYSKKKKKPRIKISKRQRNLHSTNSFCQMKRTTMSFIQEKHRFCCVLDKCTIATSKNFSIEQWKWEQWKRDSPMHELLEGLSGGGG